jgi:O-methyltransferase
MVDPKDLYLDLMKKTLTFLLWDESKLYKPAELYPHPFYKRWVVNAVVDRLAGAGRTIMEPMQSHVKNRLGGEDWPSLAHTMIGLKRLDNLQECVETVIKDEVPGDLIETGVWRGGSCIFMRSILKAYNVTDRIVWVADSFEGLPAPDAAKYRADAGDKHYTYEILRISLEEVQDNFARYGLLDEQVKFLKGWFKSTLPSAPIKEIAVLRLDGDMYESTWDAMTALYPKLSDGGFCIVDDYVLLGCREAVHDYRKQFHIVAEIVDIDGIGAYWRSTGKSAT